MDSHQVIALFEEVDELTGQMLAAAQADDWDRRGLTSTRHGGMTMISADLPGVEGEAVLAALDALAESLRVDGDLLHLLAAARGKDAFDHRIGFRMHG